MNEGAPAETARDRANREQLAASDPAISAFVAASAGSGKTKLLTDRLLRLMLTGAPPERIQCLTFTKAAAAEMRAPQRAGRWVTLPLETTEELSRLRVEPTARPAKWRGPSSPGSSTFPAVCGSAPSTSSASRYCAASRWRPRSRRISS
jgi:superfamily I DNA/RNA helicase